MTQPIRVIVVGVGRWGRHLARAFHERGALAAVVDPDPIARDAAAAPYDVPAFDDLDRAHAEVADATAVAIATPAATHGTVALHALDLGHDVFVEKPLALSMERARCIVTEAERRGCVLMVGHILLYHPAIEALVGLVRAGDLGEIRYVYSNRLNLGRVRQEENILWSFAPHDIAVILHLLDESPTTVEATGGSWLQPDIVDVTVTHLDFASGAKAHVFVSWLHPEKEQRLVVVGSRKMAKFDDVSATAKLVVSDVGVDVDADGIAAERKGSRSIIDIANDEPLGRECDHFLARCRDRATPLTGGAHGLRVLEVLAAAERSLGSPRS